MNNILNSFAKVLEKELLWTDRNSINIHLSRAAAENLLNMLTRCQTLEMRKIITRDITEIMPEDDLEKFAKREIVMGIANKLIEDDLIIFEVSKYDDPARFDAVEVRGTITMIVPE